MPLPLWRRKQDDELLDEIQSHLEMAIQDRVERGDTRQEAELAVRREFGNVLQVQEITRDMWGWTMVERFLQDLRYALRVLAKSAGFTAAAVITLALAIGANTAMFTVVNAVLLTPLPFSDPDRLVTIWERHPTGFRNSVSMPTFADWRERAKSFQEIAATSSQPKTLLRGDKPQEITVGSVTPNYFGVLGVGAAAGRTFVAEDGIAGREHSVILTNKAWRIMFGSEPNIVGQTVSLDNEMFDVVGVLSPNAILDNDTVSIFAPLVIKTGSSRTSHGLTVYGRLAPGVTIASAQSEMNRVSLAIGAENPESNRDWGAYVDPIRTTLVGNSLRSAVLVLFGAVSLILLIGCANVTSLLLVRASSRQKEFALRAALGASRSRLTLQLITESMVIAALGVVGATVLGWWLLHVITAIMPAGVLPPGMRVQMDWRVLLFTCAAGAVTAVLFGLAPALQGARTDLNVVLQEEARGSGASRKRLRLRTALVVGEVAVAFTLLMGSALLVTSLSRLLRVDPGFDGKNLLAAHVSLPKAKYSSNAQIAEFYRIAEEQLAGVAGVKDVAFATDLPLRGWSFGGAFEVKDQPGNGSRRPFAHLQSVSNSYFRTLQIPLLRGRAFDTSDNEHSRPVIIVNQTLAEKFFPGQEAVGKYLVMDFGAGDTEGKTAWEIVGVSARVKVENLAESATRAPEIYFPLSQQAARTAWLSIRSSSEPMLLQNSVVDTCHKLDPTLPLTQMGPMEEVVQRATMPAQFRLRLFGAFAALGLVLAMVGIYSVRSYAVGQRVPEIGIRMALGATPGSVLRMFLREGTWIVTAGVLCGVAMSVALSQTMVSMLYSVRPHDPVILIVCAAIILVVGLAASLLPARRAARVSPVEALTR